MTNFNFIGFLIVIYAAILSGCQSNTQTPAAGAAQTELSACEKAKRKGNYNTAEGRMYAKGICTGVFAKLSAKDATAWGHREYNRQASCKAKTGKFCDD
ncbi:hypothetical protein [Roseibium aggregatum]|uniref:hypothetical protein n=1 Tax=Roseibium aggregatum TaxID=187304 RepID=UPI0011A1F171|nr:hypothetical protein [Roseibium aggregatum]